MLKLHIFRLFIIIGQTIGAVINSIISKSKSRFVINKHFGGVAEKGGQIINTFTLKIVVGGIRLVIVLTQIAFRKSVLLAGAANSAADNTPHKITILGASFAFVVIIAALAVAENGAFAVFLQGC